MNRTSEPVKAPGARDQLSYGPGAPVLQVRNVSHSFSSERGNVQVLHDLNLDVRAGEFVSIVGPSGCGKTTLLRILGQVLRPVQGQVELNCPDKDDRSQLVGFVFQSDRLLPWRTVLQNVELALESGSIRKQRRQELAKAVIERVGLGGFGNFMPHELSGGMRQRVNVARALVGNPALLLMDEPFAALDALTRERMQQELLQICQQFGASVVFVTHQIDEAVYLGDRVIVLSARPSTIKETIVVPFGKTRPLELKTTEPFFDIVNRTWFDLHPRDPSDSHGQRRLNERNAPNAIELQK